MKLTELQTTYKPSILAIADKYGAENIRVFGSVVRDEATNSSDIDFLVHLRQGTTLFDLGGLYNELKDLLHCEVDIVSEKAVSPYLREKIFQEARPL